MFVRSKVNTATKFTHMRGDISDIFCPYSSPEDVTLSSFAAVGKRGQKKKRKDERSPLVASARTHIRPERAEAVAGGEFRLPAVGADDRGQGRSHV